MNDGRNDLLRQMMRDLPDETPSLQWRSGLNERLRQEANRRERRARLFQWQPALALAMTAALAAVFFLRTPETARPTVVAAKRPAIEAALVAEHRGTDASLAFGSTTDDDPIFIEEDEFDVLDEFDALAL